MNKKKLIIVSLCFMVLFVHAGYETPYHYTYPDYSILLEGKEIRQYALNKKLIKLVTKLCGAVYLDSNLESENFDDLYKKIEGLLKQGANPRWDNKDYFCAIETAQMAYEYYLNDYYMYGGGQVYGYNKLFLLEKLYKKLLILLVTYTVNREENISNVEDKINCLVGALMNEWLGYVFYDENKKEYTNKVKEAECQIWPDKAKKEANALVSSICICINLVSCWGGIAKEVLPLCLQELLRERHAKCLSAGQKLMKTSMPFHFKSLRQIVEGYICLLASGGNTDDFDFLCKQCIEHIIKLGAKLKSNEGQMCWDIDIKMLPKFFRAKDKAKRLLDAQKKVKLLVLDLSKKNKTYE